MQDAREQEEGYTDTTLLPVARRADDRPVVARRAQTDIELATLGWVHWHNTTRLHGFLGDDAGGVGNEHRSALQSGQCLRDALNTARP